ncbi:MAG: anthranilate phosphoribosyltransferase [Actinomycetota bacterium]
MDELSWPHLLARLLAGRSLSARETSWAMETIREGNATPAQFGAFVAALRAKGETTDEILGLVTTMRRFARRVVAEGPIVDTCGTGGDRAATFNVSTVAAFIAAGAGARVAKHGNRAASSACGSADLLEELGVRIDLGPEGVAACLEQAGIGFCFAPVFHPSMRHVAGLRRELGVPTVFNFLGPLTNPAGARHQALGVSEESMAPKMAEVLGQLGSVHALVFCASDGLDEITLAGPTRLWEQQGGRITESVIEPLDLGLARASREALRGGGPSDNANIVTHVLTGGSGPTRDCALINAAAAIIAADLASDWGMALVQAQESVDSGRARAALERLIEVSNRTRG